MVPGLGDLGQVEQGQGPADGLLGAAVGIAVQGAQQRRGVELGPHRDRQAERAGARQEALGVGDRHPGRLAGLQPGGDALGHPGLGRPDGDPPVAADRVQALGLDGQRDPRLARRPGFQRQGKLAVLVLGQGHLGRQLALEVQPALQLQRQAQGLRAAGEVLQRDLGLGPVPRRQEARQQHLGHHRVADHQGRGAGTDGRLAVGDRHQAQPAGEVRDLQADHGPAPGVRDDVPLEERDRAPGPGGDALGVGVGCVHPGVVAARPLRAARRGDQLAVEVAQVHGQAALPQEVVLRRRGSEAGQGENALVDRGQGQAQRLAGDGRAVEPDRHLDLPARGHGLGQLQRDLDLALRAVDGEPAQAQGPHRQVGRRPGLGPEGGDQEVGPRAPVAVDLDGDLGPRLGQRDRLAVPDAVVDHLDQGQAGEGRLDLRGQALAVADVLAVQGQLQGVGRVRRLAGEPPAAVEAVARRSAALGVEDVQAEAAVARRPGQPRQAPGVALDLAAGQGLVVDGDARPPGAVLPVPVVLVALADPLVGQAPAGDRAAFAVEGDGVEGGRLAALQPVALEQRAQADLDGAAADRQAQGGVDRTAVDVEERDLDPRRQGRAALRQVAQVQRQRRPAGVVGLEGLALAGRGRQLLLHQAEAVALVARIGPGVPLEGEAPLAAEPGGGGAVEVGGGQVGGGLALRVQVAGRAVQLQADALGHKVLDQEGGLADAGSFRVQMGGDRPAARPRRGAERDLEAEAAERVALGGVAVDLGAVGPQDHDGQGQARHGPGLGVAQQGRKPDRLAGPVDAALAVEVGVDRAGQVPAGDAAFAEIEGGAAELQEVEVAAPAPRRQVGRPVAAPAADQAGREAGHALGIGSRRGQHGVVAGDQLQPHAGQGLRRLQRAGEDVEPVVALQGHQPQVRDQQPLLRQGGPVAPRLLLLGRARDQDVKALAAGLQRLFQGDLGGDLDVLLRLDRDAAFPDQGAPGVLDLVDAIAVELLAHQVREQGADQVALVDVVEPQLGLLDVDRLQWQPFAARFRKDVALAGEADPRLPVGDAEDPLLRLLQLHARRRGQAGPHLEPVALAVAQAAEAEPLARGRDVDVLGRLQRDVVGGLQGQGLAQRLGEDDAGARHRVVALHADLDHAQLEPFDQHVQPLPVVAVGEGLDGLVVEVDRDAVFALPQVDLGQGAQGPRAAQLGLRLLVAQIGRRRSVFEMMPAQIGLCQARPVRGARAVADRLDLRLAGAPAPEARGVEKPGQPFPKLLGLAALAPSFLDLGQQQQALLQLGGFEREVRNLEGRVDQRRRLRLER